MESLDETSNVTPEPPYDSYYDTTSHIHTVQWYMGQLISVLVENSGRHDQSKLSPAEKPYWDKYTPMLAQVDYDTVEYYETLSDMQPVLNEHYSTNAHHPQYSPFGLYGMTLPILLECICDWKASCDRHGGSFELGLEANRKRFLIDDITYGFIWRTAWSLGWLDSQSS